MPKFVISSHNVRSNALKRLADALSEKVGYKVYRVTPENVRRRTAIPFQRGINKTTQLAAFKDAGVPAPNFATSLAAAKNLTSRQIVIRKLTASSEGRGASVVDREALQEIAPLYTEYIPKKKEFRVHVFQGKVIDVQEKRKRRDADRETTQIRNTANGYVFCRDDVVEPADLRDVAVRAVQALGRTQGGVDVIWNERRNQCYVLEVNSRPGIEGTTVQKYVSAILGE